MTRAGVGPGKDQNGNPIEVPYPDMSLPPDAVVTSITIEPHANLKFNTLYTIELTGQIQDLEKDPVTGQPAPKSLANAPQRYQFTTFGPQAVGQSSDIRFGSAGISVLGNRAYVPQNASPLFGAKRRTFDITDIA